MFKDETSSPQQLAYWLALLRIPGLGNKVLHKLVDDFASPEAIFRADKNALLKYGLTAKTIQLLENPSWTEVESDLKWFDRPENHLINIYDQRYPTLLKQIHNPPIALYVSGNPDVLTNLQLSLVGSRNPTPDGRRQARDFACRLAELGITITSGLAAGIDSYSHLGALDAAGTTIGVLGSGLDIIYPSQNIKLAGLIMENGALVSEFPLGVKPLPANFPRRNRIISGLSVGTLVVEAARKSGSLITARYALEQGREVFAIPGSIHNPLSRGCHTLLRQGAKLVEEIGDIIEEIGALSSLLLEESNRPGTEQTSQKGLDERSKLLLDNIGKCPVSVDYLVEETNLAVNVVSSLLLNLELQGLVEALPGGDYIRI